jgi:3-phenylpropionate/trans-cinnamate dioxygenase ferredoxin component
MSAASSSPSTTFARTTAARCGPLSEGDLEGFAIACPRHGAKFDIRSGAALTMPATQPTAAYEVKVEDGQVLIKVGE